MTEHFKLMVPRARASAPNHQVHAPFDQSLIATVESAGRDGAERALANADELFNNRDAWLSPGQRIEVLERATAIMRQRRDELAVESAREGGKPLIDSQVETDRAIDGVKLCVEHLRTQGGKEIPVRLSAASAGRLAVTVHEPIGIVLAFSAFNHPLNLIVDQVAPRWRWAAPLSSSPPRRPRFPACGLYPFCTKPACRTIGARHC